MIESTKADPVLAMAASLTERACDLLRDGWVSGTLYKKDGGAPVSFCILGALEIAYEEMFGHRVSGYSLKGEPVDIAKAFILDEALGQHGYKGQSIPGFNDSNNQERVLSVMSAAANRLWALSIESEDMGIDLSAYTEVDVESEPARQYLHAVLA